MRIRDILQEKGTGVKTINNRRSIHDAVGMLNKHRIGALVVTAEGVPVAGIITERDILRTCGEHWDDMNVSATQEETACTSLVQEAMTEDVVTGSPEDDPNYAMAVMTRNRIRHLPILDDGNLAGIISIGDLVNAHLEERVIKSQTLKDYLKRNSDTKSA